jgi:hypothetical protein
MCRHIPISESALLCHKMCHIVKQCRSKQTALLFGGNAQFCNNIEKKQTDRTLTVKKACHLRNQLPILANSNQNIRYMCRQTAATNIGEKEVFASIIDLSWALRFSGLKRNARQNPTRAFVEAIIKNSSPTAYAGGLG